MKIPLKITFRDMPPSKAIEAVIREKASKLDSFCGDITSCRVIVDAPHRHHHKGKAYVVRINMTVPGGDLAVNHEPKRLVAARVPHAQGLEKNLAENHEPSKHAAHADAYVAIRDAFNAVGRKLQDYARRRRRKIRAHASATPARKLLSIEDYPVSANGRKLYFREDGVWQRAIDGWMIDSEIYYSEVRGEQSPQASVVRVIR